MIDETLRRLLAVGIKPIILGVFPQYRAAVPTILAERLLRGDLNPFSGADIDENTFARERATREHFAVLPGVKFVSVLDAVCPNGQCPLLIGDVPAEYDDHHLTSVGSSFFAQRLAPEILR